MGKYFERLFTDLEVPLRALVIALAGGWVAGMWLWKHPWLALVPPLLGIVAGAIFDYFGQKSLPGKPRMAVFLMELGLLGPMSLGVIAAAASAIVIMMIAPSGTASESEKASMGVITSGLGAFFVAGFVGWSGDQKDSRLSDHIKDSFVQCFGFVGDPDPKKFKVPKTDDGRAFLGLIGSDPAIRPDGNGVIEGWGRAARRTRARLLQELMHNYPQ